MTNDHDSLFRHTFSQPEHAASLLRSLLPPAVADELDWSSLQIVPGSSVDEALQARHADLLFTVTLRGVPALLYVLIEHKSDDEPLTAFQVARYVVRAYDRYLVDHPDESSLPPVVPIVVHHGPKPWRRARSVGELVDLSTLPEPVQQVLRPLQLDLRFLLDDLAAVSEDELLERSGTLLHRLTNLLLQFVRPAVQRDPTDFVQRWFELLTALWAHPEGRQSLYAVFSYLASQIEAPRERFAAAGALIHDEVRKMGKTIADQFREEGLERGRAEGEARGEAKGRAELLLRLCWARFGAVTPAAEARLRGATIEQLDAWAERLLSARGLDDLLA
jgi:predicted transposase/invertase (TIGR01784 family)